MCIAIIKPIGSRIPGDTILRNSFDSNSDGAGFAYSDLSTWTIRKGLQTFDEFMKALDRVRKANSEDPDWETKVPMAFHFRIGTHGSSDDPKHTHPFPLSSSLKALEALSCKTKRICMHNGILSDWGTSRYMTAANQPKDKEQLSDTMQFIRDFVAPIQELLGDRSFHSEKKASKLVGREVTGSRFTVMEPDGRFVYWGNWITDDGCYYSNAGYRDAPVTVMTAYSNRAYRTDWYGDYAYEYDTPVKATKKEPIRDWYVPKHHKETIEIPKAYEMIRVGLAIQGSVIDKWASDEHLYKIHGNQLEVEGDDGRTFILSVSKDDRIYIDWAGHHIYQFDGESCFERMISFKNIHIKDTRTVTA